MSCFSVLILMALLPQSVEQSDPPPASAEIPKLIADLESRDFRTRQKATRSLKNAGAASIAPLFKRIQSGRLELGVRAMSILERAYAGKDKKAIAAADVALEALAESKRQAIAELALAVLNRHKDVRTRLTVQHLLRFNAALEDYTPRKNGVAPGMDFESLRPPRLILDNGWKGGISNLKYVKRLAGAGFHIYVVAGIPVPERELLELEAAFEDTIVTRRGEVMLGVLPSSGFGPGVTVREVVKGSSADLGDIHEGDRLMAFNGEELQDFSDLVALLKGKKVGDVVEFTVLPQRQPGQEREVQSRMVKLKGWRTEPKPKGPATTEPPSVQPVKKKRAMDPESGR